MSGSQGDHYAQAAMKSQLLYLGAGLVQQSGEKEKCIFETAV
jgi:hypothetical protein